ncbi:alternate signal-mediated exported protein, RER_14450 family [Paramicrobacterium humi]|uniref:Alternate signal-mediated exported protein, RER_14450 family n=1 Tax=Paramicrobacterium humi TaxID=640635 RepID=A0A1H4NA25_9MICO|nr:alternate-type signal peptide domain-containing protein [Microbacterium humi]SEB92280.1 alternate signal-mediated exported protein, RER_14450 family [Microbacterium humi]
MKKSTTAALAGGLGFVLLLGGAGTLAYWSDADAASPETIASGTLDLGTATSGNWTVRHGANDTTPDAYTGPIVPGDILTKTIDVPVTMIGQNLAADLTVANPSVLNASAANQGLQKALKIQVVSVNGKAGQSASLTAADDKKSVPVVVSVTFPSGASSDNAAASQSLQFGVSYTLTQKPIAD